ncbi:MarR family winged helix-turn-helix transcriptional regulator [Vibrio mangrovi]|uniref:MarR family transcriptional regulator n=1 Tax=Vibrio mangrovi TaxID=474394 RepID=A0A1Y6IUD8_9VIBR|nr:MarR family transcriptional regulator [Vibrio mangrovi]MDW6001872.1 MarR family transcriptional regulator [Vibrio mangrovi]SMS00102.1 Transcriptional regulator HosA [Vibrio mangrovi]
MSENNPFKYDVADASPGFLLWKLTGLWHTKLSQVLSEYEITQTQYAILASLRWFKKQDQLSTQASLVSHTKIEKMTMSKAIRQLESAGLVTRKQDEHDKRLLNVYLTAKGSLTIEKAIQAVESADENFFGILDNDDLNMYKKLTSEIIIKNDLL